VECREALHTIAASDDIDPWHGWRMRYTNPTTGGPPLPTISCYLRLMPKGFVSKPYRATDSRVFSAVEGGGVAKIDDQTITFGPRDVFVAPSWSTISFDVSSETVLFEMSDRGVQQMLDLWREERLS
jgi:gentisate 1,2-dioxygenase